ncbi:AtuA-related protein [Eisenibacter elegans]|uniref:AtuA-related protein n=1 Tax=Eisenibacter elegans TaxID=997 RepID=UPI00040CA108|nr:hypothetical protein [Eisenibacter elegans]
MTKKVKLYEVASARSGDKGDICNIGLMASSPELYPLLRSQVTADRVKAHFGPLIQGKVERFEWEAIETLNFVCHQALGGGGASSMRMDPLGKNFSSLLLQMEVSL